MSRNRSASILVLAALAWLLVLAGCERNGAGTFLAPTGIRPKPEQWRGAVVGMLFYDPLLTPDLATPPYPPTRLELWRYAPDTLLVAVDSLPNDTRWFEFHGLSPSIDYRVIARSTMFYAAQVTGLRVNESAIDAGNMTMSINPNATAAGMEIIGTMPGFTIADLNEFMFPIDVTQLSSSALGVWQYPSLDYPDGQTIAAGTYRFKFATQFPSTVTNMTGWGNPIGGTLVAPVTNHPAVHAAGSATDVVMTFPTTGVYRFLLDERRQTFTVEFDHATPAHPRRLARR